MNSSYNYFLYLTALMTILLLGGVMKSNAQIAYEGDIMVFSCIDTSLIDLDMQVPTIYEPVCGCNGETYPNEETALYHHGVVWSSNGPCTTCDLQLELMQVNMTCYGATACVGIFGGNSPYTFTWLDGTNTDISQANEICFDDLQAGNYQLIVTDAEGCAAELEINIPIVDYFINAEVTNLSCHNSHDGAIDLEILEDLPLSFEWFGPAGFHAQTEDIEQLAAGWYEVLVTTLNGECYTMAVFEVTAPEPLMIEVVFTEPACSDQVDGCALISGGTGSYTLWVFEGDIITGSVPDIQIGDTPSVTDMELSDQTNYDPSNANGSVFCANDIADGTYLLLAVDANGCYTFEIVTVQSSGALQLYIETSNVNCHGAVDGWICFEVLGGQAPFEALLTSDDGITMASPNMACFENLTAGNYQLTVFDSNGCSASENISIESPAPITLEFVQTSEVCDDQVDGCLLINGGTEPYNIWIFTSDTPIANTPTPTIAADGTVTVDGMEPTANTDLDGSVQAGEERCANNIPAGTYHVFALDANGCWAYLEVVIEPANPLTLEFVQTSEACDTQVDGCLLINGGTEPYHLWVFTSDGPVTDVPTPNIASDGTVTVDGMEPTTNTDLDGSATVGNEVCANDIPAGIYHVFVLDANGCWAYLEVVIEEPQGIELSGTVTNAGCNTGGEIDLTVNGAYPPYFFQWSNGATTEDLEGLSPGTYTVQVYNTNDLCTAEATFEVGETDGLAMEFTFETYGEFACAEPIGGTAPYTVEWFNLGTNEYLSSTDLFCVYNLDEGAYMVTITDATGCSSTEIFGIEEKPCDGGVALVDPSEIFSGSPTVFQLLDYSGTSVQWQFKMDFTGWLDIPGATSDYYPTPPINMGLDNDIEVRAKVTCDDGTVLYSTVDILHVIGSDDFNVPSPEEVVANGLFSWDKPAKKDNNWTSKAFPTVSTGAVNIDFKGEGQTKATITVTDFKGKVLDWIELDEVYNGNLESLNLANYTPGMYFITVTYNDFVETHRVFIER